MSGGATRAPLSSFDFGAAMEAGAEN
eukprot:SAG31_NODE_39343_length_289_cov_0.700000_1_plen_25_part_10